MKYNQHDFFDTVKSIIMERYDGINPVTINNRSSLKHDFGFDSLDILEIIMEVEKKYNISIEDTSRLEKTSSLGEFCYILTKQANQKAYKSSINVQTKEDVFKYVNEYLLNKYNIMNARIKDNFFIDLHFTDFDRSDLIVWAETTFNIKLPRTYFINLEDFCDNVLQCLPKQNTEKQPNNKLQMFFTKIQQLVK